MPVSATISVKLSQDEVRIEPGGNAVLQVEISNLSSHPDTIGIEVEGLDYEWVAIPVPSVVLEPTAKHTEKILLKVPRRSESTAGAYPFVVRAHSMETGSTVAVPATLLVEPFSALSVEVYPRRGVCSYWRPATDFEVTVHNLGNTPLDVRLYATDPDDVGIYTFEREVISIQPGASETVMLSAEPSRRSLVGKGVITPFTITARCVDNAYVAVHTQAQLAVRPLLSPITLSVFGVLLIAAGLWAFTRPKPIQVIEFSVEPSTIQQGGTAVLRWHVTNASEVTITPEVGKVATLVGSHQVMPSQTTTYRLVAVGRGGRIEQEVILTVQPAPEPPPPVISSFKAEPIQVNKGEPVTLSWQVQNAVKLLLSPIGEVDPLLTSIRDTPTMTTTYTLTAINTAGQKVEKRLTVKVRDPNALEIIEFRAEPAFVVAGNPVTLRWRVQAASRVVIDNGVGEVSVQGETTVSPTQDTVYTLSAYNEAGEVVSKSVKVTVAATPPISTPPPLSTPEPGR